MEKFPNFLHKGEQIFYPRSYKKKKKIIWSTLFKFLKDTISKTNTCFRQHHDFLNENFSKGKIS